MAPKVTTTQELTTPVPGKPFKPVKLVLGTPVYLCRRPRAEQGVRVGELNFLIPNSELGTMTLTSDAHGVVLHTTKFFPARIPWSNVLVLWFDDAD